MADIARHSSLNSHAAYVKDSQIRKGQRSVAVRPNFDGSPVKKKQDKKRTPRKNKKKDDIVDLVDDGDLRKC